MKVKTDPKLLNNFLEKFWFAPNDALLRAIETNIWNQYSFKNKKILSIGVGDGRYDLLIFKKFKKIDVGIDIDKRLVELARKTKQYKKVYCVSSEKVPFKNGSFDVVFCNSTLEHIANDLDAVSEISRVLKKGGVFLFSVPTKTFIKNFKSYSITSKTLRKFNSRVGHKHYYSIENWKEILNKRKINIIRSFSYMDKDLLRVWWQLFKISTVKPYHRELWSYLKDSQYGKYAPKRLIIFLLKLYLRKKYQKSFSENGSWVFIEAVKK